MTIDCALNKKLAREEYDDTMQERYEAAVEADDADGMDFDTWLANEEQPDEGPND